VTYSSVVTVPVSGSLMVPLVGDATGVSWARACWATRTGIIATDATVMENVTSNEICDQSGYTPGQLVVRALKNQIYHWERFYLYVTTPSEKPEDFSWPEDPMFCLAFVSTVHFLHSFTRSVYDPIAFKQQKEHAPAEWSFSSFAEPDEDDPADWWKTLS
jgi:hypothetical protein